MDLIDCCAPGSYKLLNTIKGNISHKTVHRKLIEVVIGAHVGARGAGAEPDATQNADAANHVAGTDGAGGGVNEHAAPAEGFVPAAGIGVGSGDNPGDGATDGALHLLQPLRQHRKMYTLVIELKIIVRVFV